MLFVTDLHKPHQYKLAINVALLISGYQINWIFSLSSDVSLRDLVSFSFISIMLIGILSFYYKESGGRKLNENKLLTSKKAR